MDGYLLSDTDFLPADETAKGMNLHSPPKSLAQGLAKGRVGGIVGGKGYGIAPLNDEGHGCPLPRLPGLQQRLEVLPAPQGRGIGEEAPPSLPQLGRWARTWLGAFTQQAKRLAREINVPSTRGWGSFTPAGRQPSGPSL